MSQELISCFEFIGEHPSSDIIEKCLEMCLLYKIDAEEFVEHWSAFNMTYLKNVPVSLDGIILLEQRVLNTRKALSSNSDIHKQKEVSSNSSTAVQECNVEANIVPDIDIVKEIKSQENNIDVYNVCEGTDPIFYVSGTNSEKVVASYGKKFDYFVNEQSLIIDICGNSDWYKSDKFTALYSTQARIAQCFDKHIEEIGHIILGKNKLEQSGNEGSTVLYGRIKSEDGNKVNNKSIVLETTSEYKGPKEVLLNINSTQNYSIFSGQVVAARGMIAPRNTFIVQELYTDASPNFPMETLDFSENLQIVVAAGPFTICDNVLYEPLQDLLQRIVLQKPNVLILVGPLIDTSHPKILTMADTYEDHFEILVKNIMECLVGWAIQVVLVPSSNDAHHFPIFPTPSYVLKQQYQNLTCVPNPCMLNINGLILGLTSLDILFQLTKEETSRNSRFSDRMSRLASHLISQRSFCPLYPNRDTLAAIDYEHFLNECIMDTKPHILILPSTLRYFIKNIDNCLVVNPERLVKNHTGGTYATFTINPSLTYENVIDCISCQIKNI